MKTLQVSSEEKIDLIQEKFRDILEILGLDTTEPSLQGTPKRVAKMYVTELFSGLDPNNYPTLSFSDFSTPLSSSTILVKNISLQSYCEHHFVPMVGHAHIAYLPKNKIIGLSKLNRIADYFAKRPQLQERLTLQIAENLREVLETEDVAVYTTMQHFCVQMRGIKDKDSQTDAHVLFGQFQKDPELRKEFLLFSLLEKESASDPLPHSY